jgi:hypothetical protein
MNEIKVEILPDGISCRTLNRFGDKPVKNNMQGMRYAFAIIEWQKAESERKVYRIESPIPIVTDETGVRFKYHPGDVVEAIKIDENIVKII